MISVNGKETEFIAGESITALLKRMNYVFPLVVVKIDEGVIPKASFSSTIITDDAEIKVIHLTSGG